MDGRRLSKQALRNCASGDPRSWAIIATAVMAIVASSSLTNAELRGGSAPVLAIPRREARTQRGR